MSALREKYPDPRFHPLVVLHEIEALVLAAIDAGYGGEHFPARELKALRREITRAGGPEKVNDGAGTAPSKRLERIDPQYLKPVTGPNLIEAAGLEAVVERCPTFASWWHGLLA